MYLGLHLKLGPPIACQNVCTSADCAVTVIKWNSKQDAGWCGDLMGPRPATIIKQLKQLQSQDGSSWECTILWLRSIQVDVTIYLKMFHHSSRKPFQLYCDKSHVCACFCVVFNFWLIKCSTGRGSNAWTTLKITFLINSSTLSPSVLTLICIATGHPQQVALWWKVDLIHSTGALWQISCCTPGVYSAFHYINPAVNLCPFRSGPFRSVLVRFLLI